MSWTTELVISITLAATVILIHKSKQIKGFLKSKMTAQNMILGSAVIAFSLFFLMLPYMEISEKNENKKDNQNYPSIPVVYHQTPAVEQSTSLLAYGPHFLEQNRVYSFVFTGTEKVWFNPTHPGDSVAVEIRGKAGRWKQYAVMDADNVIRRGGYTDFVGRAEAGTYSVRLLTPSTTVDFTNTYVNPSGL